MPSVCSMRSTFKSHEKSDRWRTPFKYWISLGLYYRIYKKITDFLILGVRWSSLHTNMLYSNIHVAPQALIIMLVGHNNNCFLKTMASSLSLTEILFIQRASAVDAMGAVVRAFEQHEQLFELTNKACVETLRMLSCRKNLGMVERWASVVAQSYLLKRIGTPFAALQ